MPRLTPVAIRCSLYELDENFALTCEDLPLWREAGFPVDRAKGRLLHGLPIDRVSAGRGWIYVLNRPE